MCTHSYNVTVRKHEVICFPAGFLLFLNGIDWDIACLFFNNAYNFLFGSCMEVVAGFAQQQLKVFSHVSKQFGKVSDFHQASCMSMRLTFQQYQFVGWRGG